MIKVVSELISGEDSLHGSSLRVSSVCALKKERSLVSSSYKAITPIGLQPPTLMTSFTLNDLPKGPFTK